jgi:hypothetical protein
MANKLKLNIRTVKGRPGNFFLAPARNFSGADPITGHFNAWEARPCRC